MKVLIINGSPKANGNTSVALSEMFLNSTVWKHATCRSEA